MKLRVVGSPIYVEDVFIMLLLMIAVMILQPVYKPSPVPASHCFISLLMMRLPLSSQQIAKSRFMFSQAGCEVRCAPVIPAVIHLSEEYFTGLYILT